MKIALESRLRINIGLNHQVDEINALRAQIEGLKRTLKNLKIPESITGIVEHRYSFKDRTRRFMAWFSLISMAILALAIWLLIENAGGFWQRKQAAEIGYKEGYQQGLQTGRTEIYNALPENSQKFLDRKFTDPDKTFWKWNSILGYEYRE